jgi:hypothetical protein
VACAFSRNAAQLPLAARPNLAWRMFLLEAESAATLRAIAH